MKKTFKDLLIIVILLWFTFTVLLYKTIVFDAVSYSLTIWFKNLLPSMFPFFVISSILIQYHITNYIPIYLKKTFCYLFGVSESVVTIFFLSIISGFPSNARITRMMYDEGEISLEEANRVLIFTHFSSPLFILSTVAVLFLHQKNYGYLILISHYLGNILLGIFTRPKNYYYHIDYTRTNSKSQNFSKILIDSIRSSVDTILLIAGILTCFLVCSSIVIKILNVNDYLGTILKGILEITMGLKQLSLLKVNDVYKVVISTIFISFGGLSVHLQVISQLVDTKISYYYFFIFRIFHAIISGVICYFFYLLFF